MCALENIPLIRLGGICGWEEALATACSAHNSPNCCAQGDVAACHPRLHTQACSDKLGEHGCKQQRACIPSTPLDGIYRAECRKLGKG